MTNIEQALEKTLGFGKETFVKKALQGGWEYSKGKDWRERIGMQTLLSEDHSFVFLDPLAWIAVGKVEGWEDQNPDGFYGQIVSEVWQANMHRFIDNLTEGV